MDIVIPKIGMTMVEATVVEWLQPDGASVRQGDLIYILATDKVESEVEAEITGTLHHGVAPGTTLPVGEVVGWLLGEGEVPPRPPDEPDRIRDKARREPDDPESAARPVVSPNARRLAREHGIDLTSIAGSGPGGRLVGADIARAVERSQATAAAQSGTPTATIAARMVAGRLGLDLADVTAPDRAPITRSLVEREVASRLRGVRPALGSSGERPMSSMRSTIAQRLHRSLQEMAQLTIGMDASVDRVLALRGDVKAGSADAVAPTITDFVVRATALALLDHPALNASLVGDVVAFHDRSHIGVAVALDEGLVVPVVRDADALTVGAIAAATRTLAAAARAGTLAADDLRGATFCVTSLGSRGVDFFTPIVNPPNVAILGIGRVRDGLRFAGKRRQKPIRTSMLTLSLTFDHRAVDGAPAADFLAGVRDYLARPARLM